MKPNYGYGWYINRQFNRRAISHPGGVPGFTGMMTRFPDDKVVIILLGNLENSQVIRASRDLAAIMFGEKYEIPAERISVKVDPKVLVAYVGEYEDRPGRITTILIQGDALVLKCQGSRWVCLCRHSPKCSFSIRFRTSRYLSSRTRTSKSSR